MRYRLLQRKSPLRDHASHPKGGTLIWRQHRGCGSELINDLAFDDVFCQTTHINDAVAGKPEVLRCLFSGLVRYMHADRTTQEKAFSPREQLTDGLPGIEDSREAVVREGIRCDLAIDVM